MTSFLPRAAVLAAALAVLATTVATAAPPVTPKTGTYTGKSAANKSVKVVVTRDRKTHKLSGRLTYCGQFTVNFAIRNGGFHARKTEAGGLVTYFRVHGYWTSPKDLSGEVDLVLGCGGRRSQFTATHT
jgi:hypothetical protein